MINRFKLTCSIPCVMNAPQSVVYGPLSGKLILTSGNNINRPKLLFLKIVLWLQILQNQNKSKIKQACPKSRLRDPSSWLLLAVRQIPPDTAFAFFLTCLICSFATSDSNSLVNVEFNAMSIGLYLHHIISEATGKRNDCDSQHHSHACTSWRSNFFLI